MLRNVLLSGRYTKRETLFFPMRPIELSRAEFPYGLRRVAVRVDVINIFVSSSCSFYFIPLFVHGIRFIMHARGVFLSFFIYPDYTYPCPVLSCLSPFFNSTLLLCFACYCLQMETIKIKISRCCLSSCYTHS